MGLTKRRREDKAQLAGTAFTRTHTRGKNGSPLIPRLCSLFTSHFEQELFAVVQPRLSLSALYTAFQAREKKDLMKTKIFPILTYQSTAIIAQSEESNLAPYLATSP
jgi:hypothetical protein